MFPLSPHVPIESTCSYQDHMFLLIPSSPHVSIESAKSVILQAELKFRLCDTLSLILSMADSLVSLTVLGLI